MRRTQCLASAYAPLAGIRRWLFMKVLLIFSRRRPLLSSLRWCSRSATPPSPSRQKGTRGGNRKSRKLPWWWAFSLGCLRSAGSPSSPRSSSAPCAPATSPPSGRASSFGLATPTPSLTPWSIQLSTRTTTAPSRTSFLSNTEHEARGWEGAIP